MSWQRAFVRGLAIPMTVAVCLTLAAAQTPPPPRHPMSLEPSTLSRRMPDQLAGIEPDKVARWTLKDAILAALEKNVDIEIERENVRLAQFDLFAARGVYDPLTSSTIFYNAQKTPNSFRFSGSTQSFVQTNTMGYNFGLSQLVEYTGGSYQVNFNNSRVSSNTSSLSTAYNPSLSASFTQPLMRNFRTDTNRHQITIAKKKLDLSDAEFRQRAIEIIAGVEAAYWDLAFAIRNEEIQRDAVKLAETQLKNNQRQVQVGTLAPMDVISAATQLESNRQQVFQAMNTVAQAESALKAMTVESPDSDFPTWRVGVNFSLPLRNRTAEANLGRALESGRQLDLQTRKQLQTIEVEVRNAYHAAETAELRVEAARAARRYAEQQLEGEQKKFSAGLSTTFLILTRQNDLSQARGVEVRALTDYNKAVADLQRAVSTTLSSNSIEITSEPANSRNNGEAVHH